MTDGASSVDDQVAAEGEDAQSKGSLSSRVRAAPEAVRVRLRDDTKWWVLPGLWAAQLLSLAVMALIAALRWSLWFTLPIAIGLLFAAGLASWSMRARGASQAGPIWKLSLAVVVIGGVAFVSFYGHGTLDIAGFVGAMAVFFGVGQILMVVRSTSFGGPWRAAVVAGACLVVGAIGLVSATITDATPGLIAVAVAVAVMPIALGLGAEDVLVAAVPGVEGADPKRPLPGGVVPFGWPIVVVLLGAVGFWLGGASALLGLGATLGLVVLVGLIVSNASYDVALLLVVATLVYAFHGGEGKVPPALRVEPGQEVVVAMGDSYLSGEGAPRYLPGTNVRGSNECRRGPKAFPVVATGLARSPWPTKLVFVACSGAKAAGVAGPTSGGAAGSETLSEAERTRITDAGLDGYHPSLGSQVDFVRAMQQGREHIKPRLIILMVGGNDVGFGEIGQTCGLPGDCSEVGDLFLDRLRSKPTADDVGDRLDHVYDQVASLGADQVLVVPYPVPLNSKGCGWSTLTGTEHRFLAEFTRELDQVVRARALAHGFNYLSGAESAFTSRRLAICDSSPSHVAVNYIASNPINGTFSQQVSPGTWFHNSFHPNEDGHKVVAGLVVTWLQTHRPGSPSTARPVRSPHIKTVREVLGDSTEVCSVPSEAPASCRSTISYWVHAQVAQRIWLSVVPLALVVCGAWAAWVLALASWRSRPKAPRRTV